MLVQSHYLFSDYLYKHFEKTPYGYLIDKNSFAYGNIKPDFDQKLRNFDHTIYGTGKNISAELKRIRTQAPDKQIFSESLGVITHFICDSFCAYHNQDALIKENFFNHFLYELKIHNKLRKRLSRKKLKPFLKINEKSNVLAHFQQITEKYRSRKSKPARDLRYALGASIILLDKILAEYAASQDIDISA